MTRETRIRLMTYWQRFPEAAMLAVLTATTTIVMVVLLSLALGGESRDRSAATRCYAAQTINMINDVMEEAGMTALAERYPEVNVEGLHCELYFQVPIEVR